MAPAIKTFDVEKLLQLKGADRSARAYAFLYASFKNTEISSAPVRDALDCLIPFIASYLSGKSGNQIDLQGIQSFLNSSFRFDVPLYALEQLVPELQKQGYLVYNRTSRVYVVKQHTVKFEETKNEIGNDFDEITERLKIYAEELGFADLPPSGSWGDALINFLKSTSGSAEHKLKNIKGAIVDAEKIEIAVIGSFLRDLSDKHSNKFGSIINIYMGVIVEEFISSISEIGELDPKNPVTIFYDTAVLLRLLGSSGRLLRIATEELTRYLQDLGFRICYFSGNETEVANILDTLVYVKDRGGEIEGETAEALSAGEITITELRFLKASFAETLGKWNVFPADSLELNVQRDSQYQIDENAFSEYLLRQANTNKRPYGVQNRKNDASYLGSVVRLREQHKTRDLAFCRYLFVTSNKFLAKQSRRFLIDSKVYTPFHCPPILHLGQVATIAWLLKDQTIPPEKAGRELLLNCFAAVRPDAAWFGYFREGIEKVVGSLDEYTKDTKNSLTLQAARRIAQNESFGNSSIVRELSMVEILQRAREESDREKANIENANRSEIDRLERLRLADAEHSEQLRQQSIVEASEKARRKVLEEVSIARDKRADRVSHLLVSMLKTLIVLCFVIFTYQIWAFQGVSEIPVYIWIITGLVAVLSVLGFMDLIGIRFVSVIFDRVRDLIKTQIINQNW